MKFLIEPWQHQKKAIDLALTPGVDDLALFFEMGTGKTGTAINILRGHFARERRVMRTLILGPKIVANNWKNEFRLHSKVKDSEIVILKGPGVKRVNQFVDEATDPKSCTLTRGKIFISNYEILENDAWLEQVKIWQPEVLIFDESHRMKNGSSVRAKKAIELLGEEAVLGTKAYRRKAKHVYILTGTPILNSAMDIFHQYRLLDSGKTFGLNFYEFRGRFFEDMNKGMPARVHFPKWVPRPETYEILNAKIYSKAVRVKKSECLDLPPLIKTRIDIQMSPEQQRMYNEMKNEYITWVKAHENSGEPRAVVAQMALTKALRLQQIVSGFARTDDGHNVQIKQNPRLEALAELLEDITPQHKVIVWATFKENYAMIRGVCDKLKIKYVEIHGEISDEDKTNAEKLFRTDSTYRVLIGNQRAGGIGINLVEEARIIASGQCSYSIFYSRNFSLADDLQAEARNYRGGSERYETVNRIDLVTKDTIDELGLEALGNKQELAEQILKWTDKI